MPTQQNAIDMKTQSDYYSSNPPKPGAADRQKQRRRSGEDVEDMKDVCESKRTLAQPRQLLPRPPTLLSRITEQARRPSEALNVSHTVNVTAPIKVVDAPANSFSGTQNADVTADTGPPTAPTTQKYHFFDTAPNTCYLTMLYEKKNMLII